MKFNRGAVSILFIITIISVLILTSIAFFFIYYEKENKEVPIEPAIENALLNDERANGVNPSEIFINKKEGQFVRGTLIDLNDGKKKTFYVIQLGDIWRVVEISETPISCERFIRIGFPEDFINDCQLSFPDAVTVAEIDETIDKFLLEGAPLQIIGIVEEINIDEEKGTVDIDISSGGESTTITSDSKDVKNVVIGDILVVTTEVIKEPNQGRDSSDKSDEVKKIIVINITEIGDGDDEIIEIINIDSVSLPQESKDNIQENKEKERGVILKINAPVTAPPSEKFFNVYDTDNSVENIEIEGSF